MSEIITFYSFKGGVGRTMALANIACAIASKGRRVLVVDWDLEAPGLHRYFASYDKEAPRDNAGTLGLLEALGTESGLDSSPFETIVEIPKTDFFSGCRVNLLTAGVETEGYERRVLDFDVEEYYRDRKGASKLEHLRETWRERFDFVLIDSRTGITDTGGICTIFLPDTLVLVFTANEQSLMGAIQVAEKAQQGRQALSFDRRSLTILPLPSRFDSRTEQEEADYWMKRFTEATESFLSMWCPKDVSHRALLERIKIPHVPYFSFGEKLPIVTHPSSDPDLPGFYYQNIANVLEGEFGERAILAASGTAREFVADISRIIKYAPAELIGREQELNLLDSAWTKVRLGDSSRPNILSFVGLGGEGKTSLVAKWAAQLAHQDWPGCDAAFAWSFYSQGTREKTQASSDSFLAEALRFFGDEETARSAKSSFDKGKRLAQLVGEKRALLILDGLEPLQYPPGPPMDGKLKDDGVASLLKGLATSNRGLCVITTPYSISDLRTYWQTTAPEFNLPRLSPEAGVHLLKTLSVSGTQIEFKALVEEVKGHALTLNLFGSYLRDAHGGDIRRRDLVKIEEADSEVQAGHAFHVMDAYVKSFESEGEKGQRTLGMLRLLGLFDRPITADSLAALLKTPSIPGLTERLAGSTEAQRNIALARLEEAKLLTVNRDASGTLISLDTHPLLREYFATHLRTEHPQGWQEAHRRLYQHFRGTAKEGDQPSLEDLQPLYQAVAHACQAGLQQEALDTLYRDRILRGTGSHGFYNTRKLGAFGSDLGAIGLFFDQPWNRVSQSLTRADQAWALSVAAFDLRALGRLAESLEPANAALEMRVEEQSWKNAGNIAANLSELELTLGQVADALSHAEQSVAYSDRSGDPFQRFGNRATLGDALHQAGREEDARTLFQEAERIAEAELGLPLYSLRGFVFCDLLLAVAERAACKSSLEIGRKVSEQALESSHLVSQRAALTLKLAEQQNSALLDIGLDHLTLGRARLYSAAVDKWQAAKAHAEIERAVHDTRRAGAQEFIARALLTRSWLLSLEDDADHAREDLDEAWEIAERGPMRLHMADIHLYRARLFHGVKPYPWTSPQEDLAAARKLIEQCGYWRRKEELEDAEEAAKNW